ncbi:MAG: ATP-binding cassette subfamily B protein [Glaciecola sp.]|jgi:ATP-binding cassette subfamily B protein
MDDPGEPATGVSNELDGRALIRRVTKRRRGMLAVAVASAVVHLGGFLVVPLLMATAVDGLISGRSAAEVRPQIIALVVVGVVRALSGASRKVWSGRFGAALGADLRAGLYQHVQRLSFSFHDRIGAGEIMSRASGDITVLEQVLTMVAFIAQAIGMGVGGVVLLLVIQPVLGFVAIAFVVVASVLPVRQSLPMRAVGRSLQDELGAFSDHLEQQIQGMEVTKGHGLESVQLASGQAHAVRVADVGIHLADLRGNFVTVFGMVPTLSTVIVLGLGGWMTVRGWMTPGELLAFVQYLGMLMAPVMVLGTALSAVPLALGAADRVAEVLRAEPEILTPHRPKPLPVGAGAVEFRDVDFSYGSGPMVLQRLRLTLPAGSRTALVGASGSGKSTLALLVPRFYDPQRGSVLLDGVPVEHLELDALRQAVAMVFEDTVVFNASVRRNLLIARPTATESELLRAVELSSSAGFIRDLPDGMDTVLGDEGVGLSGGQRQRLAIARALLRDARILILDDATSALDPDTDAEVRRALVEVMESRTTLIIAHRVETLALADRVVLIEGGQVVADGSHDELLELPNYRQALGLAEIAGAS